MGRIADVVEDEWCGTPGNRQQVQRVTQADASLIRARCKHTPADVA